MGAGGVTLPPPSSSPFFPLIRDISFTDDVTVIFFLGISFMSKGFCQLICALSQYSIPEASLRQAGPFLALGK
jgi:hypothetical protein